MWSGPNIENDRVERWWAYAPVGVYVGKIEGSYYVLSGKSNSARPIYRSGAFTTLEAAQAAAQVLGAENVE